MGPNDPNFEAKLFSLSKHFEQLIQVPDWVIFCERLRRIKFARMGPNYPNFEAKLFSLSKHFEQLIQAPDLVMYNRRSRPSNNTTGKGLYIKRIHDRSSGSESLSLNLG